MNLYIVTGMFSWSWRLNGRESMDENQWHLLKYFRDTKVFHNIYLSIFIYIYIYLYISIYLYIYICIYLSIYRSISLSIYIYPPIYLYIYMVISDSRHTECSNLTEARWTLSPQWLYGNSCTWAHDVRLYTYNIYMCVCVCVCVCV